MADSNDTAGTANDTDLNYNKEIDTVDKPNDKAKNIKHILPDDAIYDAICSRRRMSLMNTNLGLIYFVIVLETCTNPIESMTTSYVVFSNVSRTLASVEILKQMIALLPNATFLFRHDHERLITSVIISSKVTHKVLSAVTSVIGRHRLDSWHVTIDGTPTVDELIRAFSLYLPQSLAHVPYDQDKVRNLLITPVSSNKLPRFTYPRLVVSSTKQSRTEQNVQRLSICLQSDKPRKSICIKILPDPPKFNRLEIPPVKQIPMLESLIVNQDATCSTSCSYSTIAVINQEFESSPLVECLHEFLLNCHFGSNEHCFSPSTTKSPALIANEHCKLSLDKCNYIELNSVVVELISCCTWITIAEPVLRLSLTMYLACSFRFDIFFALFSNALYLVIGSSEFSHLPLVPGELESLQRSLFDASYSHVNETDMFLKVAYRAEIMITFILPRNEALHFYRYCIQKARDAGDELAEARMLIVYGQLLEQCKECLKDAYLQFLQALELLEPRGKCKDLAWLFTATGWNLYSRGLGIFSKPYLFMALEMFEDLLDFSINTFRKSALFSLGHSLFEEEEQYLQQKLSATLSSLGLVLLHMGEPREALKYLQQSLKIRLELWGDDHPCLGSTYNNISLAHQRLGEIKAALNSSLKGLAIKRQHRGTGKELVNSLNNVAINYSVGLGNHKEAISLLEEALECLRNQNALENSETATVYTSMSLVYQRMGKAEEAVSWCRKAVALRHEINGSTHQTTIRLNNRLARILVSMERYTDAKAVLERQLEDNKGTVGEDLQKTDELLKEVLVKNGDREEAGESHQQLVLDHKILQNNDTKDSNDVQSNKQEKDFEIENSTDNADREPESVNDLKSNEIKGSIPVGQKPSLVNDNTSGFEDDDGIDSEDDLYGPEDSSPGISHHSAIDHEVKENNDKPSLDTLKQQTPMTPVAAEEEDYYGCSKKDEDDDDRMSTTSTPESVRSENELTTCIEMKAEINFHKHVQQPVAEIKSSSHRQTKLRKLEGPKSLQMSRESAFVAVPQSTSNVTNSIPQMQNHSLSHHPARVTYGSNQLENAPGMLQPQHLRNNSTLQYSRPFTNNRPGDTNGQLLSNRLSNGGYQRPLKGNFLRHSTDLFHSSQIGYYQYRPQPTAVQSLPFMAPSPPRNGRDTIDSLPKTSQWLEVSNSTKQPYLKDKTDAGEFLLSAKQIEASDNVLRLVLGRAYDDAIRDVRHGQHLDNMVFKRE